MAEVLELPVGDGTHSGVVILHEYWGVNEQIQIQAHFARVDDWATVEGAQRIKDAVTVPMELHAYEAEHAFCNELRPEVYNAKAAAIAWARAVAFIGEHTA